MKEHYQINVILIIQTFESMRMLQFLSLLRALLRRGGATAGEARINTYKVRQIESSRSLVTSRAPLARE